MVTFSEQKIGLHLSKGLVVTGFSKTCAASTKEKVHVGDTIIAVNDKNLSKFSTDEALHIIRDASLPKRIYFISYRLQQADTLLENSQKIQKLRVFDIDQGLLGEANFLPAEFGSWSQSLCKPHLIEFAIPINACTALEISTKERLKGKILVVHRGSCSFLAKAWQVFLNGAIGLIIVNNKENLINMPSESEDAAVGLNIPVLMVRKSAEQLLVAAHKNSSYVQIFDSNLCSGLDSKYGTINSILKAIQAESDAILQVELDSNANNIMEDPLYRGGRIIFTWPSLGSMNIPKILVGEFLQFTTGPRALPTKPVRILWADPIGACSSLDASFIRFTAETEWFAVIERGHGCSFATKIQHAEIAGASGVVIANDMEYGMTHGKIGGRPNEGKQHKIPVIMIPLATARNLFRMSAAHKGDKQNITPTCRMALVVIPSVSALWSELEELVDIRGWPKEIRDRRKLWKKLSIRHHPDKDGGREERFEWLRYLYETVATRKKELM
jgi:hypothetical protein